MTTGGGHGRGPVAAVLLLVALLLPQAAEAEAGQRPGAPTVVAAVRHGVVSGTSATLLVSPSSSGIATLRGYRITSLPSHVLTYVKFAHRDVQRLTVPWGTAFRVRGVSRAGAGPLSPRVAARPARPQVTVLSPGENASVVGRTVEVALQLAPDPVSLAMVTDSRACVAAVGTPCTAWSFGDPAELPSEHFRLTAAAPGPHVLRVAVTDALGDRRVVVHHLDFLPPPSVTIAYPTADSIVTGTELAAQIDVDHPEWFSDGASGRVLIDGVDYAYAPLSERQNTAYVPIGTPGDGPHSLQIEIHDDVLGDWTVGPVTFTYQNQP